MTGALPDPRAAVAAAPSRRDRAEERLCAAARQLTRDRLELLDEIWDLCADDLYGLALWRTRSVDDAEDAVQEVFVRLARAPERLRRARRPRSYLLKMAHNAAVDSIGRRRPGEPLEAEQELVVTEAGTEARVDADRVAALVALLPAPQREVVYLRHLLELSFREIAAACGVPLFTAASRYRAGMRRLRRLLGVGS